MTPKEVADYAGYSVDHVRTMIRRGILKAKKKPMPHQMGFYYEVSRKEADRLKNRTKDNRGSYDRKERGLSYD